MHGRGYRREVVVGGGERKKGNSEREKGVGMEGTMHIHNQDWD